MSSVVGEIVDAVRVSLCVTIHGRAFGCRREGANVGRIPLERGRQSSSQQSGPRDRLLPKAMANGVGRLDDAPPARIVGPEQRQLVSLAKARRAHAEQSDAETPDLGQGEL
jgi:hypothetical protein